MTAVACKESEKDGEAVCRMLKSDAPAGSAASQRESSRATNRRRTELTTVQSSNRLSVAEMLPGLAARAVGTVAGLASVGVGYAVGKIVDHVAGGEENRKGLCDSAIFKAGSLAFLYAQGIFPTVVCEGSNDYEIGLLPDSAELQQELLRSTPLIIANHVSYIDAVMLPLVLQMPKFMSMEEVQSWPLFGQLGKDLDYIWVDRKSPDSREKAIKAIERHVQGWAAGDRPLMMFPEGTTSNGDSLHEFRKGAFLPGAAVRPVLVKYTGSWNPANVSFRETEQPQDKSDEGSDESDGSECHYVPYDDGDWALQYGGHLVHTCTVLVCRTYEPSEEEKADAALYAKNVRELMLTRLEELKVVCSSSSSSGMDERLQSLRRRVRMEQQVVRSTGQQYWMEGHAVRAELMRRSKRPHEEKSRKMRQSIAATTPTTRDRLRARSAARRTRISSAHAAAEDVAAPVSADRAALVQDVANLSSDSACHLPDAVGTTSDVVSVECAASHSFPQMPHPNHS
mmetsp:Transcript_101312/g.194172  ORF Transcript_101312/g.194172 Transcript_101312/m.194172 type:complete len:511 (+) Transcript_101312:165-1697(+)